MYLGSGKQLFAFLYIFLSPAMNSQFNETPHLSSPSFFPNSIRMTEVNIVIWGSLWSYRTRGDTLSGLYDVPIIMISLFLCFVL